MHDNGSTRPTSRETWMPLDSLLPTLTSRYPSNRFRARWKIIRDINSLLETLHTRCRQGLHLGLVTAALKDSSTAIITIQRPKRG